jgi:outer membrane lipoprotein-sorting protein
MTTFRRAGLSITVAALALGAPLAAQAAEPPARAAFVCPSGTDAPDAAPLLEQVEKTLQGSSSIGTMTMTIKTAKWSRAMKLKVWSRGRDYALVRVLDGGPREKGMLTLKREKQLWNYLPQAGRVMKLPSGMLGDSWMGSDFTNDDLVRGTSLVRDFDAKVTGTLVHDQHKAWRLELVPRASATVVWDRIEIILDRATCVPLVERFFDEDGKLVRSMSFSDIRDVGGRQFPARMIVKPAEAGRQTEIYYDAIELDVSVPDDTFSLRRLQQGR